MSHLLRLGGKVILAPQETATIREWFKEGLRFNEPLVEIAMPLASRARKPACGISPRPGYPIRNSKPIMKSWVEGGLSAANPETQPVHLHLFPSFGTFSAKALRLENTDTKSWPLCGWMQKNPGPVFWGLDPELVFVPQQDPVGQRLHHIDRSLIDAISGNESSVPFSTQHSPLWKTTGPLLASPAGKKAITPDSPFRRRIIYCGPDYGVWHTWNYLRRFQTSMSDLGISMRPTLEEMNSLSAALLHGERDLFLEAIKAPEIRKNLRSVNLFRTTFEGSPEIAWCLSVDLTYSGRHRQHIQDTLMNAVLKPVTLLITS